MFLHLKPVFYISNPLNHNKLTTVCKMLQFPLCFVANLNENLNTGSNCRFVLLLICALLESGKQGTFLIAPSPVSQTRLLHPFIHDRLIDFIQPSFLTTWKGSSVSSFHLSVCIQTHPSGLPFPSQPAIWRSSIHAKLHAPV